MDAVGSRGGGDTMRVNVVYFLSRDGRVEQPHLLRALHHPRGVRLRDVKRWLAEVRGKNIVEECAWSYKRRYKSGYLWEDLKDEDLITPISGNEYVLKGSLIPTTSSSLARIGSKKTSSIKLNFEAAISDEGVVKSPVAAAETLHIKAEEDISPKPSPVDEEPPEHGRCCKEVFKMDRPSLQKEVKRENSLIGEGSSSAARRASRVFRNLMRCGAIDTNDTALRPVARRPETDQLAADGGPGPIALLSRDASRINRSSMKNQSSTDREKSSKEAGEKPVYKPAGAPSCSQCGKAFRPEKLYAHMKSCKGLRGRGKSSENRERISS